MSHNVSFSKVAAQSNPDQFMMRVVIEENSFREDKEKLRYSAEELDEILRGVIEDIAKKPEEHFSLGPDFWDGAYRQRRTSSVYPVYI
jgi:hypothetical protein